MAKMIKVKVKKEFLDRYTGTKRKIGEEFDVTYDRLAEIRRSGSDYVAVVKEKATESK